MNRFLRKFAVESKMQGDMGRKIAVYKKIHENSDNVSTQQFASNTVSTKQFSTIVEFPKKSNRNGFTLIEVLLALAIIAIAFTALLKSTGENIKNTQRLTEKTITHWVAQQGITMVQLGLINPPANETITKVTQLFGQKIYWRIKLNSTSFKQVQQITITVSKKQTGPFIDPLIGYRYA